MEQTTDPTRERAVARLRQATLERQIEQDRFLRELDNADRLGLTHAEIGEIVGLSRRRVSSLLQEYRRAKQ